MTLALALLQDLGRRDFRVSEAQLIVGLSAAMLVGLCVLFHYEGMSLLSRLLPRVGLPRRYRVVFVILGMLFVHVVEVWFFAFGYYILDLWPLLGRLQGTFDEGALDFVYFSVVTYTSLGFGDILPEGAIRILAGAETLAGLSMITWTASFAFLEMQRDWLEFRRAAPRQRPKGKSLSAAGPDPAHRQGSGPRDDPAP